MHFNATIDSQLVQLSDIRCRLISLWAQQPHASNSLGAISKSWLQGESPVLVARVLNDLLCEGLVTQRLVNDSAYYFALDVIQIRQQVRPL